jgi:hypothetical protein
VDTVCCVNAERSDLSYIATEGGEQAAPGGETNSQKMNQIRLVFNSHSGKHFSFCVTIQFHSPVMRDKKKGSAPRHILQTAARAHRDEARRGKAGGGGGGGARVIEPSSHTLLPQGEELTLYVGPTPSKLARWD